MNYNTYYDPSFLFKFYRRRRQKVTALLSIIFDPRSKTPRPDLTNSLYIYITRGKYGIGSQKNY